MSHLLILIELDDNCRKLEEFEKKLSELESDPEIITLTREYRSKEKKLAILRESYEKNNLEISRLSGKLDSSLSRIKALDKILYDGSVKDIKQLEHMEKEKNSQVEIKQKLELETIDYMELVDLTDSESKNEERGLAELKTRLRSRKKIIKTEAALITEEINDLKGVIANLESRIDPDLLIKYYSIRSKRGSGVGIIKNDICLGCHMRVATTMIDKIKTGKQVCFCENCGRIHILFSDES
jgi:predicted  nucleic acid-binding Zn-ribbon protein